MVAPLESTSLSNSVEGTDDGAGTWLVSAYSNLTARIGEGRGATMTSKRSGGRCGMLHWCVTLSLAVLLGLETWRAAQLRALIDSHGQALATQQGQLDYGTNRLDALDGAVSTTQERLDELARLERSFNRTISNEQVVGRLAEVEATLDANQALVMGRLVSVRGWVG